jgi:HEPN domain-containing protein
MKPLTLEWIEKAEGDFYTPQCESRVRKSPNFDAVCFHAQQAAEKYLKAILQENQIPIPKTHQLMDLLGLCIKADNVYQMLQADLIILEGYAVKFRYPGDSAEKGEARQALRAAQVVRDFIRNRLGG